jgi:hypothetical protein
MPGCSTCEVLIKVDTIARQNAATLLSEFSRLHTVTGLSDADILDLVLNALDSRDMAAAVLAKHRTSHEPVRVRRVPRL